MRAARLHGAGDLRVDEEPVPAAGAGMSLVRVTAVGICGSDLHWWDEGAIGDAVLVHPLVLGHEGAGVIAEGPRQGERVAIDPAIACGTCRACRDGYANLCYLIRFAGHGETDGMLRELMPWPAHLLHPLPDEISDAAGALLEPLGVALHALDLGHVPFGGTVAVIGCGPIGLKFIRMLSRRGCRVIAVARREIRLEAARKAGAAECINSVQVPDPVAAVRRLTENDRGADAVVEAAGNATTWHWALQMVRRGGVVNLFSGLPSGAMVEVEPAFIHYSEIKLISPFHHTPRFIREALEAIRRGDILARDFVAEEIRLEDLPQAFQKMKSRGGEIKLAVRP